MVKIINGRELAEKIKDKIAEEVFKLKVRPNIAIILVGNKEDSKLYVNLKMEEAKKVGIDTHLYKCEKNVLEEEIFETIKFLNEDDTIDAILVQLPLPKQYDTDGIILSINPQKDLDGFHPDNLKNLFANSENFIVSPVFGAILEILENIKYNIKNKKISILSNSDIFSRSLGKILGEKGGDIEIFKADDNFIKYTKEADLLITAIGKPKFINKDMIKKDAVLIDIGITKQGDKIYGDIDREDVKEKASYLTPVPGGIGPLTIAMALKNALELFKKRKNLK